MRAGPESSPRRIAVIADLHYTCGAPSIKGAILRRALDKATALGCEAVVFAGDMLGNGTIREARELRAIIDAQPLPAWFTQGNSELRTPSESAAANGILSNAAPPPDGVVLIDSSTYAPKLPNLPTPQLLHSSTPNCERRLAPLAVTHVPPNEWGATSREAYLDALRGGAFSLSVAGHDHADALLEEYRCQILRGIDPDKASGGPPSFATFVTDGKVWRLEASHELPRIRPSEWDDGFRRRFLSNLGISAMYDPFGGLDFATKNGVECVELRHASWKAESEAELRGAVASWRAAGGRVLSMHLPGLGFPDDGSRTGVEEVRAACREALEIGCDRVTIHVPGIHARDWAARRDEILDAYADALSPLLGTHVLIGIENMHTTGEAPEDAGFGFVPGECLELIGALRGIGGENIGFHCDIGHARNNRPFDSLYPLSTWYETLGHLCNGMHIHQVVSRGGAMENHLPLTGYFDKLISLSSLIIALREGFMPDIPMFIEVRGGLGPESLLSLRRGCAAEPANNLTRSPQSPQSLAEPADFNADAEPRRSGDCLAV